MKGTILLRFYDATGNVVAEKGVRLVAGMSEGLEVPGTRGSEGGPLVAPIGGGVRRLIRASASWTEFPPGPCRGGAVFGNVEVFNAATGETGLVLPGTLDGFQDVNDKPQH